MRSRSKWFSIVAGVTLVVGAAASPSFTRAATEAEQVQPAAATTWLLTSPAALRLPPPPDAVHTQAELIELQAYADSRDAAALERIRYWDAGAPAYRWMQRAVKHAQSKGVVAVRAFRALSLTSVAISDATVAAGDSKETYARPRPDAALAAIAQPRTFSYPDEHAVTAGAASTVLQYLFPADAELFANWADEAALSRIEAGVAYPSDTLAGLELGRQVGLRAIARAQTDGSDATWSGSVPTGSGQWTGTNPYEPIAGTFKPWTLDSGSQFRPGPPPSVDSEQMAREVAEVKNYRRTTLSNLTAAYWEYYGGRAVFEYFNDFASKLMFENRVHDDAQMAAATYATVNVALYDSAVACWDAKYTYWAPRPGMVDPTITTVFATPNHPSYPSAHSCLSSAAGSVLMKMFPSEAASLQAIVEQAGEARIMGGIHFRTDIEVGERIGEQVAEVVWTRASDHVVGQLPQD